MADEQEKNGPSLEPPRLFGRGRKKKPDAATPPPVSVEPTAATPASVAAPAPTPEPAFTEVVVPPRADEPSPPTKRPKAIKAPKEPKPPKEAKQPKAQKAPKEPKEPKPPKAAREPKAPKAPRTEPRLNGWIASTLAGILTGLVLIGLIKLVLVGCGAVRNSDTCGTGSGLVLLAIVFVLDVVAGRFLLKWSGVREPGSTSFLAVGLTAIISLLFLLDVLDTWPMLIVIPAISGVSMLLSWWVSTTYAEEPTRRPAVPAAESTTEIEATSETTSTQR